MPTQNRYVSFGTGSSVRAALLSSAIRAHMDLLVDSPPRTALGLRLKECRWLYERCLANRPPAPVSHGWAKVSHPLLHLALM
jgi:hypothetical protein